MEWSHGCEFEAMSSAPVKKLPASPRVGSTGVPVTDRGGEEVDVGFGDFWAGSGNKLRDPRLRRSAGNDRKFSLGNVSFSTLFEVKFSALFDATIYLLQISQQHRRRRNTV